jgi:hypothetical protein
MLRRPSSLSIVSLQIAAMLAVFLLAGIAAALIVNHAIRRDALREAQEKARILLDHNLAIHAYFNKDLKPAVFRLTDPYRSPAYFDPAWMSSTFAVRGINRYSRTMQAEQYDYKESAINARSPLNEADPHERAFIQDLNREPDLIERSEERVIDGRPYYVVMRRGETMEKPCLQCHNVATDAPAGLVAAYGPVRSFGRQVGEAVSAISIRIPLDAAYRNATQVTIIVFSVLASMLIAIFLALYWINRTLVFTPIRRLRDKAAQISTDERRLGELIPEPAGRELKEVTGAFNRMSATLRQDQLNLEETVALRTQELREALENVKQLSGMIPICASCKKVRDDAGYWKQVEVYIREHSEAEFTHGLCPECAARLYPGIGGLPADKEG